MRLILLVSALIAASAAHAADYLTADGATLFGKFCASCHGADARGNGPVAKHLKTSPPDLTRIAQRRGGKFPAERVEQIIDGRIVVGAHGTRAMPIWGEEFTRQQIGEPEAERGARIVIERIVNYLRGIQVAN